MGFNPRPTRRQAVTRIYFTNASTTMFQSSAHPKAGRDVTGGVAPRYLGQVSILGPPEGRP